MSNTFTDAVELAGTRTTADGYLVAEARAVRAGIQIYTGDEVGRPDLATVRVYRPPTEVFATDSLTSFGHSPVTIDHPPVAVTADNWRDHAVGETSGEVLRDGEWLRIPLILKDRAAIDAVRSGQRQLSAGYTCELDWTAGVTPSGETYDAVQRRIRGNHLAIVQHARAGTMARIGDSAVTQANMTLDQLVAQPKYDAYRGLFTDTGQPMDRHMAMLDMARAADSGSAEAARATMIADMASAHQQTQTELPDATTMTADKDPAADAAIDTATEGQARSAYEQMVADMKSAHQAQA